MREIIILVIATSVISYSHQQVVSRCQCLDYWECKRSGGKFYSYCGLTETKVCCRRNNGIKLRSLQSDCGKKGTDSSLVGVTEPTEWPWHVAILERANHIYICGGSLIDELWVLTAAHCVDSFSPYNGVWRITARLGEYDVHSSEEEYRHEEIDIADIVVHPDYTRATLIADLALIRLRFPASRQPNIGVVCVPREGISFEDKTSCFVTGWGRQNESARHSKILKEIEVPLWPTIRCEDALKLHFGSNYTLSNGLICAGAEGRDACEGDGGGPLVCEDTGQWYQIGIVSFGLSCGKKDIPGVYTNINTYERWIEMYVYGDKKKHIY